MHNNSVGKRIQQVRAYFNLSRKEFIQIIKVNLSTVSRIETDIQKPSDIFLEAMLARLLVNPDWVKTGEGEMLVSPREYITKGIKIFGIQNFSNGLASILKDPDYIGLKAVEVINEMTTDNLDPRLINYLQYIITKWQQGDENIRGWLKIQLENISGVTE